MVAETVVAETAAAAVEEEVLSFGRMRPRFDWGTRRKCRVDAEDADLF